MYVDAHLDLAYNAINYQRDLQLTVQEIRAREGKKPAAGVATVSIPDLKQAGVGLVFGTLFVLPAAHGTAGELVYANNEEAYRQAMVQLDYYHRLADQDSSIRLIGNQHTLKELLAHNQESKDDPWLGIVPLMEGADPVRTPEELPLWHERGVRMIGPAWDDTRYAAGAWRNGRVGFTKDGFYLMEAMADLGMILDITHLSEKASLEALEQYAGPVAATHCNVRSLVPGERQLSNKQIQLLAERDGVIGIVLYNRFLKSSYYKGAPREWVTVDDVIAHIDHVCQLLGTARHVGIGSDFDGGFGTPDIPIDVDGEDAFIKIASGLKCRGYSDIEIEQVTGRNWIDLLMRSLA